MKGLLLVILGLLGIFSAWKIISLTRKGATKEVDSLPDIDTTHRSQKDWSTGMSIQKNDAGNDNTSSVSEKSNASFEGDRNSAIPSMGSTFSVIGK